MASSGDTQRLRVFARLALAGTVSAMLGACSTDSTRFAAATPQPGGYPAAAPDVTGSLGAAPTGRIDQQALPPPGASPAAYANPGQQQALYGTSATNVTPAYTPAPAAAAPRSVAASTPAQPATGASHTVASGETLSALSRTYGVPVARIASANNISADATLRVGQTLVIPGSTMSQLKPAAQKTAPVANATPVTPAPVATAAVTPATKPATTAATTPAPAAGKTQIAAATPAATPAKPGEKVETAAKVTPVDDADDARTPGGGPQFRAPVRGRVISSFGPKPGGAHNDGVNFAVPEGTAVRAAEDGTVAYAGNELKGYGNLVLIKHADGYVTAYAHNSELLVKRGDQVRRGQIVGKAGQSGGVNAPQLHFEIRKGSQPVDPSKYVAGL